MIEHPLYLTNNQNLASTSRILQAWIGCWRELDVVPAVVVQREGAFPAWLRDQGVPCLVDPMRWMDRRRPWQALRSVWRIAQWAGRHDIDVIHCNEHDVYPFAAMLRKALVRPTICHVRYKVDRGFAEWRLGGSHAPNALLWTSVRQKEDSADAIQGLVPDDRQHVVHLGVDCHRCDAMANEGNRLRRRLEIGEDELVVGTASPLRPRKRVLDFIASVRLLAAAHPYVVGLIAGGEIAGDEAYRRHVEREIESSGLGRRLRWLGNLNPIEPFHHACDISVSTSEYETFGNSVCEAMACGVPVVAYDGGSVGEVLGGTGRLVSVGDIVTLSRNIEQLLLDKRERQLLGSLGRDRARGKFDPRRSFNQVRNIYAKLLNRTSPTKAVNAEVAL